MPRPGLERESGIFFVVSRNKAALAYSANVPRIPLGLQTHSLAGFHKMESPSRGAKGWEAMRWEGLLVCKEAWLESKSQFNTLLLRRVGSDLVCATGELRGVAGQKGFGVDEERWTEINVSVSE